MRAKMRDASRLLGVRKRLLYPGDASTPAPKAVTGKQPFKNAILKDCVLLASGILIETREPFLKEIVRCD